MGVPFFYQYYVPIGTKNKPIKPARLLPAKALHIPLTLTFFQREKGFLLQTVSFRFLSVISQTSEDDFGVGEIKHLEQRIVRSFVNV